MKAPSTAQRILAVAVATLLLALSTGMALAAANDYRERGVVPVGVTLAGSDLGGMTESQARDAIRQMVAEPLERPLTLAADGRTWTFDPKGAVSVDVDRMLDEAYAPRRSASFIARLGHDLAGTPMPTEVRPRYTVDQAVLRSWVETVAAQIDHKAVDASVELVGNVVEVRHSEVGHKTEIAAAETLINDTLTADDALTTSRTSIQLPVTQLQPKVTEDKLGKTIVVDLSERRIRLFKGATLEKAYRCAVGSPAFPTPRGTFKIVAKRFLPTWNNPGSDWAKTMPKSIPPGPANPLGTRALNLNAPGIRIHGTTNIGSIGTAASHGCMRMVRHDIEDLYPRVPIGTVVYIVP